MGYGPGPAPPIDPRSNQPDQSKSTRAAGPVERPRDPVHTRFLGEAVSIVRLQSYTGGSNICSNTFRFSDSLQIRRWKCGVQAQ